MRSGGFESSQCIRSGQRHWHGSPSDCRAVRSMDDVKWLHQPDESEASLRGPVKRASPPILAPSLRQFARKRRITSAACLAADHHDARRSQLWEDAGRSRDQAIAIVIASTPTAASREAACGRFRSKGGKKSDLASMLAVSVGGQGSTPTLMVTR